MNTVQRAIALSCLFLTPAYSAEPEEITVTEDSRFITETSVTGAEIDADELARVQHEHIQQVLNRLAGVNLQHGSGQEYLPAIRSPVLTGAGACGAFLITEDSVPLRAAGFCNINELFESHTEQAESIQVIRGPGTALHGSNALHGVVNVDTFAVKDAGSVGVDLGSYDYSRLKVSVGNGATAAKLTLTHDGGFRADSGYDQRKLSIHHAYSVGSLEVESGLSLTHLEQETAGFITGLNAFQDRDLSRQNDNPEAYRNASSARLWSRINTLDGRWEFLPYARYTQMDFLQHFLPGTPLEENGQRSIGMMSLFNPNDSLTLGLDVEFTDAFLRQSQDQPTAGTAFLQETVPVGRHYDYDVDATVVAAYGQYQVEITDRLELIAGVRFEWLQYRYDNKLLDGRSREDGSECGFGGCRYSRPADSTDSFNNWSPKLGLIFDYTPEHQFFVNLSHGFRAPQATELYRLQRDQTIADLDSEEIIGAEVGARGGWGALDYVLSIYDMRKDNVIFRDADFFNISNGETEHRGIELDFSWNLNEKLNFSTALSIARHEYTNNLRLSGIDIKGNDVDTAPRETVFASVNWKALESLTLSLEWVSVGEYYLDPENLHEYSGHDVFNLRSRWEINDQWAAYMNIENVTDERYADRADFTTFTDERYFPGKPINFQLGVQKRW